MKKLLPASLICALAFPAWSAEEPWLAEARKVASAVPPKLVSVLTAEIERREKRPRPAELQAIVAVRRRRAGVEGHDGVGGEHASELRVHALGLERPGVELRLAGQPALPLSPERLGFLPPRGPGRRRTVAAERVEQRLDRRAGVGLDADGHRIVPADVAALDVEDGEVRVRVD